MRLILIILISFISMLQCGNQNLKVNEDKYDYLLWDDLKINGKIPLKTSLTKLEKHFGKPDRYINGMYDCGSFFADDSTRVIGIKGAIFELLKDSVVFRSVDFKKGDIFLSTSKFKLDKNTSVENLKSYFPNSFINRTKGLFGGKDMIGIEVRLDEYSEHAWYLFIDENHLVKMDYWIDC